MSILIFDSRRGRFGTQKPRQEGPLSAIQLRVQRNAELSLNSGGLGIDLAKFDFFPLWEKAGLPRGILSGEPYASVGSVNWTHTGINGDYSSAYTTNNLAGGQQITVFAEIDSEPYTYDPERSVFCFGSYSQANRIALRCGTTGGNNQFKIRIGNTDYSLESNVSIKKTKICVTIDIATGVARLYRNGLFTAEVAIGTLSAISWSLSLFALNSGTEISPNLLGRYGKSIDYIGAVARILTDDQIYQIHDAPYLLLQPNTAQVYFDFGGGGTVYDAAVSFAAAGVLSNANVAVFNPEMALAANGDFAETCGLEMQATLALAAQAAQTESAGATFLTALALSGSCGLSSSNVATLAGSVAFPTTAGLLATYGNIVTAALALEAAGGLSTQVQADLQAALAYITQASAETAGAAIYPAQLALSLQSQIDTAFAALLNADLSLPCISALSATSYSDIAAALSLTTGAEITGAALQEVFASVSFEALAILVATHPDDIIIAMRVLALFSGASPSIAFSGKSPTITFN